MDDATLITLGKIAGIGGLSIGLLVIIFKSIIQKKIFASLTKDQSYKTIRQIINRSFQAAFLGILIWAGLEYQKSKLPYQAGDVIQFIKFDSIDLKQKIRSYSANADTPKIQLRFASPKLDMNFSFFVATKTRVKDLKNSIIDHFNIEDHIRSKLMQDYYLRPASQEGFDPFWVMRINYEDYNDEFKEPNRTLAQAGVKNNDLITLKIIWRFNMKIAYDPNDKKEIPPAPDNIDF